MYTGLQFNNCFNKKLFGYCYVLINVLNNKLACSNGWLLTLILVIIY